MESVIDPSPALAIGQEAGFFEYPQVKGQFRLGKVQSAGEFADTAFSSAKTKQNPLPMRIRQGFQQQAGLLIVQGLSDVRSGRL